MAWERALEAHIRISSGPGAQIQVLPSPKYLLSVIPRLEPLPRSQEG